MRSLMSFVIFEASGSPKKTQADHLPTFMKTAKNRERIVKLLKKLQEG